MSKTITIDFSCPKCNNAENITLLTSITASKHQKLKEKLLDNELNFFNCKTCKSSFKIEVPILYHDINKQFAIWYSKDKKFIPEPPVINNYLFNAKVVNDLESLKTEILLFENQIISTKFEQQKLHVKMDYSKYKNIDECLIDFKHIYELNDSKCKYCNKSDITYGFSIICEHCGKNINIISNKKLYIAISLLGIFNHYLNHLTFEHKKEIEERINNFLSKIKFENKINNFAYLNKYLKKIKVIGNQNSLFIYFNNKWELQINEEKIDELFKSSNNPAEIIIITTALTGYINQNVLNSENGNGFISFMKRIFNITKWFPN
ncbi:CpXC domain-containing protein [Tenacibaculum halocynthiae]|uniref:CpXC domain-containing protein n=1 Tax=Tenacibaculum halocynthiae TaxID=1254437 RepID=UPI0038949E0C